MDNKALKHNFGGTVKSIRNSKNITQKKLSELTGMQYTYISKIERNTVKPNIETIIKIKNALNVSANEILGEADTSNQGILRSLFEQAQKLNRIDQEYIKRTIELLSTQQIVRRANPIKYQENTAEYEYYKSEIKRIQLELDYLKGKQAKNAYTEMKEATEDF